MSTSEKITTAVLLAAGTGSRLQPLTDSAPKCLTIVAGIPILGRLVDHLRHHGVKTLVVVIGHCGDQIQRYLKQTASDFTLEFVYNPEYASTNNIYSLWLARQRIQQDFILLESDLVFESCLLESMVVANRMAVSEPLPWMNGTMVSLDSNSRVSAIYLTPCLIAQKALPVSLFKTVNICSFSMTAWQRMLPRMEACINRSSCNDYYEVVMSELVAESKLDFDAVIFKRDAWYEIDTVEDLQAANAMYETVLPHEINGLYENVS